MAEIDQALARLHTEYEAGGETFLTRLRLDLDWDPAAFTRLTDAMRLYCALLADQKVVPRWVAELYWFAPTFTRTWTSHEYWQPLVAADPDYYRASYQFLDDLAVWFWTGVPPGAPRRRFVTLAGDPDAS